MTEQQVLALATFDNPIINRAGNKIEFANGDVFVKDSFTGLYRKAKIRLL